MKLQHCSHFFILPCTAGHPLLIGKTLFDPGESFVEKVVIAVPQTTQYNITLKMSTMRMG